VNKKKRHHFIPKAYLRAFCDDSEKVLVYRKDTPDQVLKLDPDNIAHQRYYYSQPRPDGGVDNNALEDVFCEIEAVWPLIVQALRREGDVADQFEDLLQFMALQRVRVPACRDAIEAQLAAVVKAQMLMLKSAGKLPAEPEGFEGLLDQVQVTIDPHHSIHAMVDLITASGAFFRRLGFMAVRNETSVPFLTSDNPVMWFAPDVPDEELQPYVVRPDGPAMLLFPVSPDLLIIGSTEHGEEFLRSGLQYGAVADVEWVGRVNRQTCRFAYTMVFARDAGQEELIRTHAHESPILATDRLPVEGGGTFLLSRMVFGPRPAKPKWVQRMDETPAVAVGDSDR